MRVMFIVPMIQRFKRRILQMLQLKYRTGTVMLWSAIFLLVLLGAFFLMLSPNASDEQTSVCDWRDKVRFDNCIRNKFSNSSVSEVTRFLVNIGFIQITKVEGESFYYFIKSSNNISGYRIAVIIWSDDGEVVSMIEVR